MKCIKWCRRRDEKASCSLNESTSQEGLGPVMHEMQNVPLNLLIGHEDDQDGLKIGDSLWAHRKVISVSNSMSYG